MRVQKINIVSENAEEEKEEGTLTIELNDEEVGCIDEALSDYVKKWSEVGFIRKFSYDWTVLTNFLNNGVIETEE